MCYFSVFSLTSRSEDACNTSQYGLGQWSLAITVIPFCSTVSKLCCLCIYSTTTVDEVGAAQPDSTIPTALDCSKFPDGFLEYMGSLPRKRTSDVDIPELKHDTLDNWSLTVLAPKTSNYYGHKKKTLSSVSNTPALSILSLTDLPTHPYTYFYPYTHKYTYTQRVYAYIFI